MSKIIDIIDIIDINKKKYIVICQPGLEEVLANELKKMNSCNPEIGNSMVSFEGTKKDLYRANLALRTALHILLPLKTFNAKDYNILYYQSRKINWHKLFDCSKNIRIDVKGRSKTFNHSQYTVHRVKDGILDTFRKFHDEKRPSVDKANPDISIVVYLNENNVTIYLDSSGIPLFKRGYRVEHGLAPIKEDLASGILLLSDWDKKNNVLDPMCGTGTLLIEAYMIANNIPPNLNRKFSFMNWFDYEENIYHEVKEELKTGIIQSNLQFYGYEIDYRTYSIAQSIIEKLGFQRHIFIEKKDFKKVEKNFNNFFIVSNPPYGERLSANDDLVRVYKEIGDFLKFKCKYSNASIFSANIEKSKFIGLKPNKKIKLFNGPLEGRLLKYEIY